MKAPKIEEDPAEKAARERERRLSDIERTSATEEAATALTSDLRATYGLKSGRSVFGAPMPEAAGARGPQLPTLSSLMANFRTKKATGAPEGDAAFFHTGYQPGIDYRKPKMPKSMFS